VAKARKGSRKPASRANGRKSTGKRKKFVLDLKKLRKDILRAQKLLEKRQKKAAAIPAEQLTPAAQKAAELLTTSQSVLARWNDDIGMLCTGPGGEPCGPDMVIS
jgi:hypothetical protein